MKTLKIFGLLALLIIMGSCDKDDGLTQEQEAQNMNELFSEIQNLASSISCENSTEWNFTSYGNKACGGHVGFIAYPSNIDVELFLEKIEEHRISQQEFNKKWEIVSDCSVPAQPSGVICKDGNPVFAY